MKKLDKNDETDAAVMARACRVKAFGGVDKIIVEDVAIPHPGPGELLVRVHAAGVGPWDAWIRAGKSALPQPLPLTLGADLAGIVVETGPDVTGFQAGDAVFGVTNARFIGAYAEYAIVHAGMIARMPTDMSFDDAASVPVVASTAWQALFDHARLTRGQTVLIHGAAGNVGSYAVQMAHAAGLRVIATAGVGDVDAVIDLVGGDVQGSSFPALKKGGTLVSAVSQPDQTLASTYGVTATFFLVDVNTALLERIAALIQGGGLNVSVGAVLPLAAVRLAHEMVEGDRPHPRGKIILHVAD